MKLDKNVRFIDLFVRIAYLCNVCKHSHAYEEIIRSDSVRRLRNGLRAECGAEDGEYKLYLDGAFYGIAEVGGGLARAKVKLV